MNAFFASLSKGTIAVLAIGGGIVLLLLFDPPHTLCTSQVSRFLESQVGVLTPDPAQKETSSAFDRAYDRCLQTNAPGGCYDLFSQIRKVLQGFHTADRSCLRDLGSQSSVANFFKKSVDLFARLAWGGKPPESVTLKHGWLDSADLNVFCRLKDQFAATYGDDRLKQVVESYFTSLPGAKDLPREQVWQLMLFSTNCRGYL